MGPSGVGAAGRPRAALFLSWVGGNLGPSFPKWRGLSLTVQWGLGVGFFWLGL